jgi:hypothetical protein
MKFDLKTLITLAGIIMLMGGFYYTTQLRLEILENEVHALKTQDIDMRTWMTDMSKKVQRLNKKIDKRENNR